MNNRIRPIIHSYSLALNPRCLYKAEQERVSYGNMHGGHPEPGGDGGYHGARLRRDPGKRLEEGRRGAVLPAYDLRPDDQ